MKKRQLSHLVRKSGRVALMSAAAALLTSCGGGDSGGSNGSGLGGSPVPTPTPTPTPPANRAPVITSAETATFAENGTDTAYQATATDADGDSVSFTISGGADASLFTISPSGALTFKAAPDYELPADVDGDNVYRVVISASDGKAASTLAVAISVTNSKEGIAVHRVATGFSDPVALSPVRDTLVLVAEKAGSIYALNPQSGTRTLVYKVAPDEFTIPGGTVQILTMAAAPDYTTSKTFYVMYKLTNGTVAVGRILPNNIGGISQDRSNSLPQFNAPNYGDCGWLGFDTNGYLTVGFGDAGGTGDPTGSAQDFGSYAGKILRVSNNPDPYAGASPNLFLISKIGIGVHCPTGGAFYAGGYLFTDSGQNLTEEVNAAPNGSTDYGWPFKEGRTIVRGTPPVGGNDPVIEYPRAAGGKAGQQIVGGAISGSSIASLGNRFIFGDRGGAMFSVPMASIQQGKTLPAPSIERRDADFAPDAGSIDHPVALASDPTGTVYILDSDGEVFRIDGG